MAIYDHIQKGWSCQELKCGPPIPKASVVTVMLADPGHNLCCSFVIGTYSIGLYPPMLGAKSGKPIPPPPIGPP